MNCKQCLTMQINNDELLCEHCKTTNRGFIRLVRSIDKQTARKTFEARHRDTLEKTIKDLYAVLKLYVYLDRKGASYVPTLALMFIKDDNELLSRCASTGMNIKGLINELKTWGDY